MFFGGNPSYYYSGSIGFSGVLFTLIVIDNSLSEGQYRSLFGLILIPSQIYPWALLLILQLLLRNVSFLGHLSGLLVGYLYAYNVLKILVPPSTVFSYVEKKICRCCTSSIGYVPVNSDNLLAENNFQPFSLFERFYSSRSRNDQGNQDDAAHHTNQSVFIGQGRTIGNTISSNQNLVGSLSDNIENVAEDIPQEEWKEEA